MKIGWGHVAAVAGLALAIRLAALATTLPELNPSVDLDNYRSIARSMAAGKGFTVGDVPNVARTPVYPLFLAGLIRLGGDRLGIFLTAQCILGAATCALTVILARRWFSQTAATIAGLLVAIDPNSVVRCMDLRTEVLFTCLLIGGTCLLASANAKIVSWAAAGLIWSAAALCRPIAVFLPVVVLAVWLIERQRALLIGVFFLCFFPLTALWMARNAALTGQWFLSSISTVNLLHYHAAAIEAAKTGQTLEAVQSRFDKEFGSAEFCDNRLHFAERMQRMRETAMQIICSSPLETFKEIAIGWVKIVGGPGARSLDNSLRNPHSGRAWWSPFYVIALSAVWVCSVLGAVAMRRRGVLAVTLILYFILLAGGSNGNSRFRVPVVPLLSILSVAGATYLINRRRINLVASAPEPAS